VVEARARAAAQRGELDMAEDATEGDVAFIVETGVAEDADAPLRHGIQNRPAVRIGQGLADIDTGQFGTEARQNRLDLEHVAASPMIVHGRRHAARRRLYLSS